MNWTIERGKINDAECLAHFQLQMAKESEGTILHLPTVLNGVLSVLKDEVKGTYLVAKSNSGEIVGSLLLTKEWSDWNCAWYWWIQSVFVKSEFRRQGVYTCMYKKVKELAKENHISAVRLYVDKNNSRAKASYQKLGMNESHYLLYEEEL